MDLVPHDKLYQQYIMNHSPYEDISLNLLPDMVFP